MVRSAPPVEPGYEFWYLLGILEEITTKAIQDEGTDPAFALERLSLFVHGEHEAVFNSLELMVVGLDFVHELLEAMRARRFARGWRRRLRDLPAATPEVHERVRAITETTERSAETAPRSILLPATGPTPEAHRAVRTVLGVVETAVSTMGKKARISGRAIAARLDSPSSRDLAYLVHGTVVVETAIGALLAALESELG
ncbi:MAG TPA: hypothetical protein VGB83_05770 [Actinomycetota bacterium]